MNTIKKYITLGVCLIILIIAAIYSLSQPSSLSLLFVDKPHIYSSDNSFPVSIESSHIFADGNVRVKEKPEPKDPDGSEEC